MLNYKINGDGVLQGDVIENILRLRGIENSKQYLSLSEDVCYDYSLLQNINKAASIIIGHIERKSIIAIVVDCDCDGYTSAAALYNYLKLCAGTLDVRYYLHTGKEHGLSKDIIIADDVKLVIIPDAGSNDIEQCKAIVESGKDIVILDHHICDAENPYATIVNSQNNYPNKELSGVGVVYKLLQKLDDDLWQSYADRFVDLVAVGMIGDVMDQRSLETRYLCNRGIALIRNKLLKTLVNTQSYSMNQEPTINDIAFYICPLINAAIRIGDDALKDMMFRAFIETDEIFLYKKRGETEEAPEDIYDKTSRLLKNNKTKQDKLVEGALESSILSITHSGIDNNKILFVDTTGLNVDKELNGLIATKVSEMFSKPCLMLRKIKDTSMFGGSARNFTNSPIASFKNTLESISLFEEVAGHDNAFGVKIQEENVVHAIKRLNRILRNESFDKAYYVDFVINYEDISVGLIKSIDDAKWVFCKGVDEPIFLVKNITIDTDNISIIGKNKNTWKMQDDIIGFEIVKFKCNESDVILNQNQRTFVINAICKMGINNYKGKLTPQLIVKDYEVCS